MEKIDYQTYTKPSDFLKLVEGENVIRVLTDGGLATIYGMRTARGWIRFGEEVPKEAADKYGDAVNGALKWIWIAINRVTGRVGVLEVGPMIGDSICQIAKDQGVDPREIDIVVERTGTGTKTKYKVYKALETKPLTEKEEARVKKDKPALIKKHFLS